MLIMDFTKFDASVTRKIKSLEDKTFRIVNDIALECEGELKDITPVVTGNLRNNWITRFASSLSDTATVTNATEYAQFVNYGTVYFEGYFFLEDVVDRINQIANRVIRRVL